MDAVYAALISGIFTVLAVTINGWWQTRATNRLQTLAEHTNHLVNSSSELAQNRNDQLVRTLVDQGLSVPLSASEEKLAKEDDNAV